MANLKQRLHRKNSSGSYDVIYLETLASLVKMDDGTTLTSKISSMDTAIDGKAALNHTHSDATTSAAGFMTGAMVTKLNGIAAGANAYTHPSAKQCDAAAGNHTHSEYAAKDHDHSQLYIQYGNEMNLDYGFAGGVIYVNLRGASAAITDYNFFDGLGHSLGSLTEFAKRISSTSDITAGSSSLATGTLYLVYE